jgi:hypothetical protein
MALLVKVIHLSHSSRANWNIRIDIAKLPDHLDCSRPQCGGG